jgi:hypothetical protein
VVSRVVSSREVAAPRRVAASLRVGVTLRSVRSLSEVAAELGVNQDEERSVVEALRNALQEQHPPFLAEATGAWNEPYLSLQLAHGDGTVLDVTHGDGYTAISGAAVNYEGYLDAPRLIDVLVGALRGGTTYVHRSRFGYKVADYFEVVGLEGQRIGYGVHGIAGVVPFVLRSIPLLPESRGRTRVSFVAPQASEESS